MANSQGGVKLYSPTEEEKTEIQLEVQGGQQKENGSLPQVGSGVQKPVTVLFASIKGFDNPPEADMDMIEEITGKRDKLNNELNDTILKYGGVVDKVIKGFFMATFGTKVSHQNDPAYGVLAAIELVDAVEKYGGVSQVGINSGLAWVGSIGTERVGGEGFTDITVIGDTVNLSARLKGEAANNQIFSQS